MYRLGIEADAGPRGKSVEFLAEHFGKSGPYFYGIARGMDNREVRQDREGKSVGAEDTFVEDIAEFEPAKQELALLAAKVWTYCEGQGISSKAVTKDQVFGSSADQAEPGSASGLSHEFEILSCNKELLCAAYTRC